MDNIIIDNNKLKDFSSFLIDNGIKYELTEMKFPTSKLIGVKKEKGVTTFKSIASSGTLALWLYYCWEIYFDKVTFLFIDEFDATYHFELAANIVKRLNGKTNFQTILTSHNT